MNVFHFFMTDDGDIRIGNTLIALALLIFVCGPLSWYSATALGWIQLPAKKLNVNNIEQSYTWFYTQRETVRQDAANIAIQKKKIADFMVGAGSDSSKWTQQQRMDYTQLTSIEGQQEIIYNGACATYQAKWDNVFKTAFAQAPTDIPRDCPLIGG